MTSALLIQDVESKVRDINFGSYFSDLFFGHAANRNDGFKRSLVEFTEMIKEDVGDLSFLKELNPTDLLLIYQRLEKLNNVFDKLNDLYYSSNYFEDKELGEIFRRLTRQLHKIENLSFKYLNRSNAITDSTPAYIKEGLANFSRENIAVKLTSSN
ncbi:hypothetical protein ACFFGT_18185 [Mucilaginibacter angelicae]|uniref:Uncharacterized protein n=1 Tax=Mucilaginibacter angelicae TaxID=869718 RepID=A0ABV6L9J7_9SPHI